MNQQDGFWPPDGNPFTFFTGAYKCWTFTTDKIPLPKMITEKLVQVDFNFCFGDGIGKLFSIRLYSASSPFSVEGGIKWNPGKLSEPSGYLKFCYKWTYTPFAKKGGADVDVPVEGVKALNFEVEFGPCFTIMMTKRGNERDLSLELSGSAKLKVASPAGKAISGEAELTGTSTFVNWRFNGGAPLFDSWYFNGRYDVKLYIVNKNFCNLRGNIANDGDWDYWAEKVKDGYDRAKAFLAPVLGPPRRRRRKSSNYCRRRRRGCPWYFCPHEC